MELFGKKREDNRKRGRLERDHKCVSSRHALTNVEWWGCKGVQNLPGATFYQ